MPLLSVIVPFYNVADYVEACLESLRRQTLRDLEVVLVDDGSQDGTRAVAERFCDADPRFRLVTQENQGLGPARNTGTAVATGEFLTYVDSDDVVHPTAYERLTSTLRESGSRFASCSAGRFNNLGVSSSFVHGIAITGTRTRTHITERPELVLDRMAWNKVYRRDFWDEQGYAFPAMLMEDFPVSIAAHTSADAVDVLDEVLYFWRERDGGEPSITQRSAEIGNLTDRYTSAMMVLDVAEPRTPASLPLLREHFLEIDVTAIVAALTVNAPETYPEIVGMAQRLDARLGGQAAGARLAPFHRVQSAMVDAGDADALRDLHAWAHHYGRSAAVRRHGRFRRRYHERLPHFGDSRFGLEPYEVTGGEVRLVAEVEDAVWDGDVLQASILVDTPIELGPKSRISLWLESKDGRLECPVRRVARHVPFGGEDLVEVQTSVDLRALAAAAGDKQGFWAFRMRVRSADLDVELAVAETSTGRARYVAQRTMPDRPETVVQPYRGADGYGIAVRRPRVLVESVAPTADSLVLAGTLRADEIGPAPVLQLTGRRGEDLAFPAAVEPTGAEGVFAWRAEVPIAAVTDTPDYLTPLSSQIAVDARLDLGPVRRWVTPGAGFAATPAVAGFRTVAATRSMFGNLQLLDGRTAPVVDTITWTADTVLRFEGTWGGPQALPDHVVVEHFEHPAERTGTRVALVHEGGRYRFDVDVAELVGLQRELRDPFEGREPQPWHLVLPFADHLAPQVYDRFAVPSFPAPRTVAGYRVGVQLVRNDILRLGITG
ncbi:glycosyltransferase [Marmoricola sp. RAF53]|uniref:glycosyltransferase n=1 Tax=Marmoricola sp. RAF53 TaxID=3233059 RepID=UPI003F94D7F3